MTSAIIVAAGSSRRMGFDKLSADLAGRSVLAHTLSAFQDCEAISEIVVVTSAPRIDSIRCSAREDSISKLTAVIEGGSERHLSVWNGIGACDSLSEILAVHDGARPLVSPDAITRCIEVTRETGAAALAHRITDTLKRADPRSGTVRGSVDRENLWAMETPQAFAVQLLREAYEKVIEGNATVTDEVSAVERLGAPVRLVENLEPNPKITFPGDIPVAEAILDARD